MIFIIFFSLNLSFIQKDSIAQEVSEKLRLEDITQSGKFRGRYFRGGNWAEKGPVIRYTEIDSEKGVTNIKSLDLQSDEESIFLDGSLLYAVDVDRLITVEEYYYHENSNKMLIYTDSAPVWRYNTKGFYYIYDIRTSKLSPLSSREKGFQMFAKFNAEGNQVGFVRDRNIFVKDLEKNLEIQLTDNGSEGGIINGTSDWVYEEELSLRDGWSWSPDGKYIAFFQFDESEVNEFIMLNQLRLKPEPIKFKFPLAGEKNSDIRIGVINIADRNIQYFDTGTWKSDPSEFEYIPRMGWTSLINNNYYVWILRMNRDQNYLELLHGDPATNTLEVKLKEQENTWVEVYNFMSDDEKITFLDDNEHFIWRSEMDGFNHLYVFTNDGKLVNQVTRGKWEVTNFHGYNENNGYVYYTATAESPLERHLYRVQLFQEDHPAIPEKITSTRGVHDVKHVRRFTIFYR